MTPRYVSIILQERNLLKLNYLGIFLVHYIVQDNNIALIHIWFHVQLFLICETAHFVFVSKHPKITLINLTGQMAFSLLVCPFGSYVCPKSFKPITARRSPNNAENTILFVGTNTSFRCIL